MPAYARFENDTVRVVEARSLIKSYGSNVLSILFYISIGTNGVNQITTKPSFKFTATLGNSSGVRSVTVNPSKAINGVFKDTAVSTMFLKPISGMDTQSCTIDEFNNYPAEYVQGHIYFEIGIGQSEHLLASFITAQ